MYSLAPSLFTAIVFGWTPWPYSSTSHAQEKEADAQARSAAPPAAAKLTVWRADAKPAPKAPRRAG